jgi:hypothetical protein
MAKKILSALFASDDGDDDDAKPREGTPASAGDPAADPSAKPRSLADAWDRIADQNRRLEERLAAVESGQRELLAATQALHDTAKDQLKVLNYLGKFAEANERRGREMEVQFRGVPDVLRSLPSATKEQSDRLNEIAARLYEKAQDHTVTAVKALQANHQRAVEDLIDKSLGASRRATYWAIAVAGAAVVVAVSMWLRGGGR